MQTVVIVVPDITPQLPPELRDRREDAAVNDVGSCSGTQRSWSGAPAHACRQVGGIVARWTTLEDVMDISTTDTFVPRARQLRDEPQSGRYPTRGYQQRQPSRERGAAD